MKRLLTLLLAALLLLGLTPVAASADDARAPVATWRAMKSAPVRTWQFPWSDDWFTVDDATYQHGLARCSLGMALAAFNNDAGGMTDRDANIRAYFTEAGFTRLVSAQYDVTPTVDTIGTMIGSKRVGDATLVAVAVRGGGYEDEWLSNFTIGGGTRHEGFDSAAQLVERRIRDYLTAEGITGAIKLWISGYSRAAAVSNLTAGDMTDSGLFADVYAYTFATPRTTRQPGVYDNIFNIVGKFDPVPCVPFADWGFERNGMDLFTPAQETDSDYRDKVARADEVARRLTGARFWNNTEVNHTIHTIMDYLFTILPTSETYAAHMQDIMLRVWKNRSLPGVTDAIGQMMQDAELINDNQRAELEAMVDYITSVAYTTLSDSVSGVSTSQWNAGTGLSDNVAHEHVPDVYVAWMFSTDDPAALFTDASQYVRFVCARALTVYIISDEGRLLWTVAKDGSLDGAFEDDSADDEVIDDPELEEAIRSVEPPPLAERPALASTVVGDTQIVVLPKDRAYYLLMESDAAQTALYYGTTYTVSRMHGLLDKLYYIDTEPEGLYIAGSSASADPDAKEAFIGMDGMTISPWSADYPYTPTLMTMLETSNTFHLTVEQMGCIATIVAYLLLMLLAFGVYRVVARKRHKQRKRQLRALKRIPDRKEATVDDATVR